MKLSSPADQSNCKKLHFDILETTSADVQAAVQVSKDNRRNSNPMTSVAKLLLTSADQDFTVSDLRVPVWRDSSPEMDKDEKQF